MKRKQILCRLAEVNGTKKNRCVKGSQNGLYAKKEPSKGLTLPDSRMVSMGVLSDDFATVDLREDYANLSLPKEAKFKR